MNVVDYDDFDYDDCCFRLRGCFDVDEGSLGWMGDT